MITRQIGKILRGKATPLQILMAAILGAMLGFIPGFAQGPGLYVALTLLLIILNANLGVAAIVGLLAKLVSFALLPLSFQIGRLLLDGPTQGLFKAMINAPVLALFGLEHYATAGSLVTGFAFGVICGCVVVVIINRFRAKMASLEEGSERYQKYANKGWVKLLTFVFVGGGKGKKTYAELMAKRAGNPIRILGVAFAALVVLLLWLAQGFLSGPILTAALKNNLERANGATVDVGKAAVNLKEGRMLVSGLAMADPNALDTDLLRVTKVEADISATDLLRKRARFDRLALIDATMGERRSSPGRLIGPAPVPSPAPPPEGDAKTIDDYIKQAQAWKERLAQVRKWLERISGPGEDDAQTPEQKKETLEERIKRQIRESGYAYVRATHLIEGAPTLTITKLMAHGVKSTQLKEEVLDVDGENLSTHPHLLAAEPRVTVKSRSGNITAVVRLPEFAAAGPSSAASDAAPDPADAGTDRKANRLRFTWKNLPADLVASSLRLPGKHDSAQLISGGTMDVDLRGGWSVKGVGNLDLPLKITLRDTTITLPEVGASPVKELNLALGLKGPMDNPRITVDEDALADALVKAGADKLASHVRGEAEKKIDEAKKKAEEEISEKLGETLDKAAGDKAKDAIKGLIPGSK